MKPHQLRPATTGHSSLLTSATSWMDARRLRIQRRRVERGIVPQVLGLSNEWAKNVKVSCLHSCGVFFPVLGCPERGVTCVPSCDASSVRSLDNVTSTRQCASK